MSRDMDMPSTKVLYRLTSRHVLRSTGSSWYDDIVCLRKILSSHGGLSRYSRERESRNADRKTASENWYGPPRPTSRIQTRKVGTYCRTSLAVNLNDIGPLRSGQYDQIENHAYTAKRSLDLDFKFYILRPSHTYCTMLRCEIPVLTKLACRAWIQRIESNTRLIVIMYIPRIRRL